MQFHVAGDTPVPTGDHQMRGAFDYDGGGLAKGGTGPPCSLTATKSPKDASTPPCR
jgi:hypothetical protein